MKTCLGAGVYNLDTIISKEGKEEKILTEEVGGTCGNIMAILPYFGWKTFPVARLDNSEYGLKLKNDLERFKADTRFVTNTEDGGTTILKVTHKTDRQGNPKVNVQATSPRGGRFPNYRYIKMDQARELLGKLDFVPDVFFFDTPNAGHRIMAEALHEKGTMVYFEPGNMKDSGVMKSIDVSDIIKFSNETIPDLAFTDEYKDKLFIQTQGAEGLQFNFKGNGWIHLDPVKNDNVVDWEGAGDWTTSSLINILVNEKGLQWKELTVEIIKEALAEAQQIASKSVSYMGSKGMIQNSVK